MAMHNKTLNLLASRLGLADEDKVIHKAAEFERLLQTKTVAGTNMTDNSKIVICLELAAGIFGADLDVKVAIKYSGLKPAMYTNNRKIIQNLLELNDDKLTTLILCNALQCTTVQTMADKILCEYQKHSKLELDLNLPQYVCMAVFQACRINKVKVSKSKIIEKSRLKPAQWSKLDADWAKFVDENFAVVKKKRGRAGKNQEEKDGEIENMEVDIPAKVEELPEPEVEPYEDWKKRMLNAAYKELNLLKDDEDEKMSLTPRRSPRKTPQKLSPYKNPKSGGGVRLLFPIL